LQEAFDLLAQGLDGGIDFLSETVADYLQCIQFVLGEREW
jgi:hypothetical protein